MMILRLSLIFAVAIFAACVSFADEQPYFRAELIFDTIPGYPSHHGSTVAELPDGTIMAAWYSGAAEKATDVAIYASWLKPGETQWPAPVIIHDTMDRSDGNPVLFVAPDGKLWLYYVAIFGDSWNDCPVFEKYSTDGGRTWSGPVYIREKKEWMTRNKPLVLRDGRILLPLYDETVFQSHFMISGDNGATWQKWGMIKQYQTLQPTVIERDDGSLYCMMRTGASNHMLWESLSLDKGKTWKPARESKMPNPGAAADMVRLRNGHVVLAFNNSRTDRNPLSVALSEDEGRTWKYIRNLDDAPGKSYHYPAIIEDGKGIIHVTYTYNRDSIKHAEFNEAWIREGTEKPAE